METKSTAKEVKRLLIWIDYAHNILPYYGFLHHAGYLMTRLSSKTSNLFHENIRILRSITFSSISSLKVLWIRQNFNEKLSEYIISHKLYLYFTFDIILNTNKEIDDFKIYFLDNLPFIDQSMFKKLFFRLTTIAYNNFYYKWLYLKFHLICWLDFLNIFSFSIYVIYLFAYLIS